VQSEYGASVVVGGSMLAVLGLSMAASRFALSGAARRFSLGPLMVVMALAAAGATAGILLVHSLRLTVVLLAIAGLFGAVFWPCVLALGTEKIGAGSSLLLAMLTTTGTLGFGIHPSLVGLMARARGDDLRFALALVPISFALSAVVGVLLVRRKP
jgi:fucose permease